MSKSFQLSGPPIEEENEDGSVPSSISVEGLNATPMKAPQASMGTGGGADSDDDPMGRIPQPNRTTKDIQIKGNQFAEESKDMGTSYDPPATQEAPSAEAIARAKKDEDTTQRMLRMLEGEMSKGRKGGAPSDPLDMAMYEIAKMSTEMVQTRKKVLSGVTQTTEVQAEESKVSDAKPEKIEKKTETGKERRQRLHDAKRSKKKGKEQTFTDAKEGGQRLTQEEMNAKKQNQQFENYYKGLGILGEQDFEAFYQKLKEPLDICFRINSIDNHKKRTLSIMNGKIDKILADPDAAGKAPTRVPWYPNQLAYCFNELGRQEMRKSPVFKDFHQFLVQETENGRIFRQEKVSMIPVTILKIEPQHSVLDMCAAPGSKTIQILEYLHRDGKMNPGYVIANDLDVKRAYLLTHQARRLNSPSLFVVQNDARFLPNLRIDNKKNNLRFDRILCDVPCSGDGTFRKNNGLWKNFHNHMGHGNHPLQLDILERGFKLLKKGGRLVYSTCTFNPIENEAVVAAAVARHIKQVKIVDVSNEVSPHLKYRPGLTSWKVFHRGKGKRHGPLWYRKFEDVEDWRRKVVKETMFTDTYTFHNTDEDTGQNADPLGLRNCMRFYPHDDNQGGFFVCVIEKILDEDDGVILDEDCSMDAWSNPKVRQKDITDQLQDFIADFEAQIKKEEEQTGEKDNGKELAAMKALIADEVEAKKKEQNPKGNLSEQIDRQKFDEENKEFPFVKLLDHKPELWNQIVEFFGIDSSFPSDHLAFQQDTSKNIILLNDGLNKLLEYRRKNKLNVVNIGLKMFCKNKGNQTKVKVNDEKNADGMDFRLLSEGVEVLLPYISSDSKRVINVSLELFLKFTEIHDHMLTFEALRNEWKSNAFDNKAIGSAIIKFDQFAVTIWIGKNNVSLMISKEEINSIKSLLKHKM